MAKLSSCVDLIDRSKVFLRDSRIKIVSTTASPLANLQKTVEFLIRRGARRDYLSPNDRAKLESILGKYHAIVDLNEGYPDLLALETVTLLNDIVGFVQPHTHQNVKPYSSFRVMNSHIRGRAEQISAGEYFWNYHVDQAARVLQGLAEIGVRDEALERRAAEKYERLKPHVLF